MVTNPNEGEPLGALLELRLKILEWEHIGVEVADSQAGS